MVCQHLCSLANEFSSLYLLSRGYYRSQVDYFLVSNLSFPLSNQITQEDPPKTPKKFNFLLFSLILSWKLVDDFVATNFLTVVLLLYLRITIHIRLVELGAI